MASLALLLPIACQSFGTIEGTLVDEHRRPVPGARVTPKSEFGWIPKSVSTDRQGRFSARVRPGGWGFEIDTHPHLVVVEAPRDFRENDLFFLGPAMEFMVTTWEPDDRWLRVEPDRTTHVVLELPPPMPTRILIRSAGEPLRGARVSLALRCHQRGAPVAAFRADDRPRRTDHLGIAAFPGLLGGEYSIQVDAPGAKLRFDRRLTWENARADRTAPLDVELELGALATRMKFVDEAGRSVRVRALYLSHRELGYSIIAESDGAEDGSIPVPYLYPGAYWIHVLEDSIGPDLEGVRLDETTIRTTMTFVVDSTATR